MPAIYNLSDVFISYSRRDGDYVRKLEAQLRAAGQEVWIDWEDIPATADWWSEIRAGIEGASTFVFIISPDSVTSDVCSREIDHAIESSKRLVPVLYRDLDETSRAEMHPSISSHNWVLLHDDEHFDQNFPRLIQAIQTDLDYVRAHTRLLVRAREWELRQRDDSFLLTGTAVQEAESWLASSASLTPPPIPLQAEYILASQKAQTRRQRRLLAGVTTALLVALALALLSFGLFRQSQAAEATALARSTEVANQAATSASNADAAATSAAIASTNEAEALRQSTAVVNQAATSAANADIAATNAAIASTNEAEAFRQSTAVVNQAATSDSNAEIAATNESIALLRGTQVANQAATSMANADIAATNAAIASTNEAEALARGTDVANQAATSVANADEAQRQAERAAAIALASQAETAISAGNLEFAALLGIEALDKRSYTWEAERVLTMAILTQAQPLSTVSLPDAPEDSLVSPDGSLRLAIDPLRPQQAQLIRSSDDSVLWTLIGHTDAINGAVWSPDGQRVATFSQDSTARIWDAASGQTELNLLGHRGPLLAAAWSSDGQRLATASEDGTVRIWNTAIGGKAIILNYDADALEIQRLAYAENDRFLVMVDAEGAQSGWELPGSPQDLVALARQRVTRSFTDEEAVLAGLPLVPSAPPPAHITSCEGGLPSKLYPGVRARVSSENNLLPLNVRVAPGIVEARVGQIAPDQTFQVIEGPVCGPDQRAWFRVVYGLNARGGWIAEGEITSTGTEYFAEPIPGR